MGAAVMDMPVMEREGFGRTFGRKHKPKYGKSREPKKAPRYQVILWNDDYNTVDHVVAVLLRVLGGTFEAACQMMAEAHVKGKAIVYIGGFEQAEQVKDKILGHAPCDNSPAECAPTRLIATLEKAPEE